MHRFKCNRCGNWVELPERKGGVLPWTPTCNNNEAHHHVRGELMEYVGPVKTRRSRAQ